MTALLAGAAHAQADPVTFGQTGLNTAIPDNDPSGISFTLTVSGLGAGSSLSEASVGVTHPWVGDLIYTLSHGGTTVTLMFRPGSKDPNILTDSSNLSSSHPLLFSAAGLAAATTVGAGCVANETVGVDAGCLNTSFIPDDAFSAFDGIDLNGEWLLNVADVITLDRGSLDNWALTFDDQQQTLTVPEPAGLALVLLAGVSAWVARHRRVSDQT
ncbi:PEP-CTERM sorting domain-containing protein [Paucibacter sp. R3-3]|uniref:PEP-CTERM sorting domain-containing protein n=1 Tax=Roseateles agri TaxID=3098619 RepID=A0ABU5DJG2_9BURK|nr:PEP-CTERM sorting domain-containing protein [Paucibacter sp. R3-3]MDY0746438.1 PEP-CTERM sorting domain-containing protein [Paucibacter sp. R3-3]